MTILRAITIAFLTALTGCAATDHIYNSQGQCLTCFNNPFTGEAINHDGSNNKHLEIANDSSVEKQPGAETQTQNTQSFDMHQVTFNSGVNVDVAFIALKDEFQFRSAEEVRKEMGTFAEYKLRSSDYEWEVLPQVAYTMGSERELMGSTMNLVVTVNKRTDSSSVVIAKYWPRDKSINAQEIGNHLLGRIQKTLSN